MKNSGPLPSTLVSCRVDGAHTLDSCPVQSKNQSSEWAAASEWFRTDAKFREKIGMGVV